MSFASPLGPVKGPFWALSEPLFRVSKGGNVGFAAVSRLGIGFESPGSRNGNPSLGGGNRKSQIVPKSSMEEIVHGVLKLPVWSHRMIPLKMRFDSDMFRKSCAHSERLYLFEPEGA